jgi:hypothetical protein
MTNEALHYTVTITRNTSGTWSAEVLADRGSVAQELLYDPIESTMSACLTEVGRVINLDKKGR